MPVRARLTAGLLLCWTLGCVGGPPPVEPTSSAVWGQLRLVPREGVEPGGKGGAYADRRLRDVTYVDYSKPGFAVVWVESGPVQPVEPTSLTIEDGPVRTTISPRFSAQRAGGRLLIENHSSSRHAVSSPEHGILTRIEPGGRLEIPVPEGGEMGVFLLDVPGAESQVFVSPGPFSLVSSSGRYALSGLAPGPVEVHAWHPRFPPVSVRTELRPGEATRLDLEMGVAFGEEEVDAGR